jgi:hypothetical protein
LSSFRFDFGGREMMVVPGRLRLISVYTPHPGSLGAEIPGSPVLPLQIGEFPPTENLSFLNS